MAINVRNRNGVWYGRGTVVVAGQTIRVPEFRTGGGSRTDAEKAASAKERAIFKEHSEGGSGRVERLSLTRCLMDYQAKPGGLQPYDDDRVTALIDAMGDLDVAQAADGWRSWIETHPGIAPATAARWRTILAAALRYGCESRNRPVPKLPSVQQKYEERVVFLSASERRALLRSYTPYAACPVLLLAYQGMRTQEALRLDWRHVDVNLETIFIRAWDPEKRARATKTGRGRTVPMHPRVSLLLNSMWHSADKPDTGPVFLSSRGEPYQDTQGIGGNPLKKQHANACTTAGVTGFRVHDWRHDWAARCVMSGMDLYTLMKLGGWTSLRMVEKYASVTAEHARAAVKLIA